MPATNPSQYKFSFGPWNISEGADPFGPTVRPTVAWADKLQQYKKLGFDGVQFHDDDAVPEIDGKSRSAGRAGGQGDAARCSPTPGWSSRSSRRGCGKTRAASTAGSPPTTPKTRQWALDRSKRTIDIAHVVEVRPVHLLVRPRGHVHPRGEERRAMPTSGCSTAINALLEYDKTIRIAIEPKPNEPMDHAYVPTIGHALALARAERRPEARRRADRDGPRDPRGARSVGRDGLRAELQQALVASTSTTRTA